MLAHTFAPLRRGQKSVQQIVHMNQREAAVVPTGHDMNAPAPDRPEHLKHRSIARTEHHRRPHDRGWNNAGMFGRCPLAGQFAPAVVRDRLGRIILHPRAIRRAGPGSRQRGNDDKGGWIASTCTRAGDSLDPTRVDPHEVATPMCPDESSDVKHRAGLRFSQGAPNGIPVRHVAREYLCPDRAQFITPPICSHQTRHAPAPLDQPTYQPPSDEATGPGDQHGLENRGFHCGATTSTREAP